MSETADEIRFTLGQNERLAPGWRRFIDQWALPELERLRSKNDRATMERDETSALRGRIAALKSIIALDNPPQLQEAGDKVFEP